MLGIQTILAPTDFSECSQQAFHLALALAREYRARLLLLHIATPPPFITQGELQKALQRPDGYRSELESRMHQLHPTDGPAGVEYRVEDGNPAVEILHVAREVGCDLIVIGTHGRTSLDRLLMGSVAEEVVRKAPCPVVTVKFPRVDARSPLESAFGPPAEASQVSS